MCGIAISCLVLSDPIFAICTTVRGMRMRKWMLLMEVIVGVMILVTIFLLGVS